MFKSVPDGFSGQRLVVLPRPVVEMAKGHPLLKGLYVTDAGYFPHAARHGMHRQNGCETAILILCREGRGWVKWADGCRRPVGAGDAILIAPGQAHAYGAADTDPWTIHWTHFAGRDVPHWWAWLQLPPAGGLMRLRAGVSEQLDLGSVSERLGYDLQSLLLASASLRRALASLEAATSSAEAGEPSRRAVERVEGWMREHSAGQVSLAGLAHRAGLSPSHFSTLFRERYGFSPVDYFLRLKIQLACHLLDQTPWPVNRVAAEIGIDDPLYFSRRFRTIMGVSPRTYRQSARG